MSAFRSPISRIRSSWAIAVVVATFAPWIARSVEAVPLTIVDPIYEADQMPAPPHASAGSTAHIFENSITLANAAYYQAAFDAWNFKWAPEFKWTLVDGGPLANLGLTVSTFDAFSYHTDNHNPNSGVGGVDCIISIDYDGADRNQLRWTQGLYVNYQPYGDNGFNVTPYYDMDYFDRPNFPVQPAYPYQFPDQHFEDSPAGPFDNTFFEADAFLSKIDYNTRTLTLYDGVEYGFFLHVEPLAEAPEPDAWVLMVIGLALGAVVVRGKHRTPSLTAR